MNLAHMTDRIRNEGRVPTIAVGAVTGADQVNEIIASGCADLCALLRPLLSDAAWVSRESAKLGYRVAPWPAAYQNGKGQLERRYARPRTASRPHHPSNLQGETR